MAEWVKKKNIVFLFLIRNPLASHHPRVVSSDICPKRENIFPMPVNKTGFSPPVPDIPFSLHTSRQKETCMRLDKKNMERTGILTDKMGERNARNVY